ncbi:polysaccharide pyruvyl transferase family protein [Rhodococcus sp. JS3073]|nr:polysaccharide pyruvyl transferase family protein [Rhodococcus sp. JS3073]
MGYSPAVTVGQVDASLRNEILLKQYIGNPRLQTIDSFVPRIDLEGIATLRTFRGVLDASGYALGDPWGTHTATWLSRKYDQWKAQGLTVVALPQAYGPFEDRDVRELAVSALKNCDRIYAREQESYDHILSLGIDGDICRICPDITIGEGWTDNTIERAKRLVIVPNWHLSDKRGSSEYIECLTEAAEWGKSNGFEVVGLLHEGPRDLEILRRVSQRSPFPIISDLSGWDVKKYIAESAVVVAGRYHAVVAALATGTPVITHSWSHKYKQLLRDFGVEHWLTEPGDAVGTIRGIESMVAEDSSEALRRRKLELIGEVDRMWSDVHDVLSNEI